MIELIGSEIAETDADSARTGHHESHLDAAADHCA